MLLPGWTTFYWMGLAAHTWPNFQWTDGSGRPSPSSSHWGYYMPQNIIEPNNMAPPELCVGANASQAFDGAWGWADAGCAQVAAYMCRRLGELWLLLIFACCCCETVELADLGRAGG